MLNTCKSSAQFFRRKAEKWAHGARVRNTWTIYPLMGNNPPKGGLIPHNIPVASVIGIKARKGVIGGVRGRLASW